MGNTFKTAFFLTAAHAAADVSWAASLAARTRHADGAGIFAAVHELRLVFLFRQDRPGHVPGQARCSREELPRAYQAVERLTQKIGIPMPKMYVIPTDSPNAFATGRNPQHASVAVTQGILNLLNDEELEGVLAHELGHVRNRDILISSIAATIAGAITYLAEIGSGD